MSGADINKTLIQFLTLFLDAIPHLLDVCKTEEERHQLYALKLAGENVLYETVESGEERPLNVTTGETTDALLGEASDVLRQATHGRPETVDIAALLPGLTRIIEAIAAPSPVSAPFKQMTLMAPPPKKSRPSRTTKRSVIVTMAKKSEKNGKRLGLYDGTFKIDMNAFESGSQKTGAKARSMVKKAAAVHAGRPEGTEEIPAKEHVVNTGFALASSPDRIIVREMPLKAGESYFFWLEIGEPLRESIEETPAKIQSLPEKTRLTIAVFGYKDGLSITPGADVGELEMGGDGTLRVTRQPLGCASPQSQHACTRLFFPIGCPAGRGTFRMRCNIYREQVLLQSRVVYAKVTPQPKKLPEGRKALRSILDFTLSQTLSPALVTRLAPHSLNILINDNDDGTNSLLIYGSKGEVEFKRDDIRFAERTLSGLAETARNSLRLASWGSEAEWKDQTQTPFKYQNRTRDLDRLGKDLINMAQWGHEFYIPFEIETSFEEVLLEPSFIQISMKDPPTFIFPMAMIYDYPVDVGAKGITLCPSFVDAFMGKVALEKHECFLGNCPTRNEEKVVCPSGFWGFRHYLGMPLSVEKKREEGAAASGGEGNMAAHISFSRDLTMTAGFASDFNLLKSHIEALDKLKPKLDSHYVYNRDDLFTSLKTSPHLVYFYCHGALLRDQLCYLQVGTEDKVFPSNLAKIRWAEPRPLVFLNGCHTVDPLAALTFVEPLVRLSKSSGVIGTEITIYEEMATVFAEEFFSRFLAGDAVGVAVRNGRLKLLEEGNPLGLAYIPYVTAGLQALEGLSIEPISPTAFTGFGTHRVCAHLKEAGRSCRAACGSARKEPSD